MFQKDFGKKGQYQSFSEIVLHHQNAKSDRAIQNIMNMASTFMVHVSLHCIYRGVYDLSLRLFDVRHAVWFHNRVPNQHSSLTPIELLKNKKSNHRHLLRYHVWGCTVYVLDPKLHNGRKIPRWNRRARLGQFLGFFK